MVESLKRQINRLLSMRAAPTLGFLACALTGGCAHLPIAGPTTRQVIEQQVVDDHWRFDLIDVDENAIRALSLEARPSFFARFKEYGKPPVPKIGIGDSLQVTIWQLIGGAPSGAAAGPVSEMTSLALPVHIVGPDGGISIPYAGRIVVAGKLPTEVESTIEERLGKIMVGPKATVTITNSVNNVVSVSGDAVTGARMQLPLNGERLEDIIAAAGGVKAPVYNTVVSLTRHGVTVTIPMGKLVSNPNEDIYAWPGDILRLIVKPRSFMAFGATGHNAQVNFDAEALSMANAVAKAGGLVDIQADPTGVFLLRYEPTAVVEALHTNVLATGPAATTPVVYRVNLRDPKGYLLARSFPLEDDDILYVADASLTVAQKVLTLLSSLAGIVIPAYALSTTTGVAVTAPAAPAAH
jgi:polysaccharide biosynthesis/export protein